MAILWHIKFFKGRKKGCYSAGPIKSFAEFLSYRCSLRLKIGKICGECLLFNGLFTREVAHFSIQFRYFSPKKVKEITQYFTTATMPENKVIV